MNFPCDYQGVLYPAESTSAPVPQCNVASLVEQCSRKIVMDSTSTKRALEIVPSNLCYCLMKAALSNARDRSIEVLIAHWPFNVLSLRKFAPPLFDDIGSLNSRDYVANRMRRGLKYTTCLAHTFVECLKKRTNTRLRFLDLSGYPSGKLFTIIQI